MRDEPEARAWVDWVHETCKGGLCPETHAVVGCVDRKWILLVGGEGSAESCPLQIYWVNNKYSVNLSDLHILWYVRNARGKQKGKKQQQDKQQWQHHRKIKNNGTSTWAWLQTRQCTGSFQIQTVKACNLKAGELLDYFRDGVNGLGIREQTVGDGCDDVKGTFQKLPWVRPIQLLVAEHTFNAIPRETWRHGRRRLHFFSAWNRDYMWTQMH